MGVQIPFDFDRAFAGSGCDAPARSGAACAEPEPLDADTEQGPEAALGEAADELGEMEEEVDAGEAQGTRHTRASLETQLQVLCGRELSLLVTDNERTMISTRSQAGRFVVRVHHMFLDAPERVLAALGDYLTHADPGASARLLEYIKAQRGRIRRAATRRIKLRALGEHHNLQAVFDALNTRYFAGQVQARVTWAKQTAPRKRSRRSIKLGSYHSGDKLIRVHPVLDAAWVPQYFVEFIVYHEMLHQVVVPTVHRRRREFHCAEFRTRERQFADYDRATAWERDYLRRLLRS